MRRGLLLLSCLLLLLAACKDDPIASYETYQDCFDDRVDNAGREVVPALVECCVQFLVEEVTEVCGDTMPDCVNYLTDNVAQIDASTVDLMEACQMVEDMLDTGM